MTVLFTKVDFRAAEAYSKGPGENFGLEAPTPGFGAEWTRSKNTELKTQRENQEFLYFERSVEISCSFVSIGFRFDRYAKST